MSALIVGLLLVTALDSAGSASRSQIANVDRGRAMLIASALAAEIVEQAFENPDGPPVFGPESGETTSPATRANFDDVDDYHNWSSAPQEKSGAAMPNGQGLTTTVQVSTADPNNLVNGAAVSADVKRVNIQVLRGTKVVASLVAVVTK